MKKAIALILDAFSHFFFQTAVFALLYWVTYYAPYSKSVFDMPVIGNATGYDDVWRFIIELILLALSVLCHIFACKMIFSRKEKLSKGAVVSAAVSMSVFHIVDLGLCFIDLFIRTGENGYARAISFVLILAWLVSDIIMLSSQESRNHLSAGSEASSCRN